MTYTVIFAVVNELFPVIAPWEADSRDHVIVSVCEWIATGLVPVDVLEKWVRFLPAFVIDGFDVEGEDEDAAGAATVPTPIPNPAPGVPWDRPDD